ncbi:MAG: hypothetical protein SRB2_03936 [Desulfobacteraceae bacterium Eth-SRB2]|nr:MAG: hypothetical protein SRB2_03936 [Desulfobacteraceae bacterium Eth-SRB2]
MNPESREARWLAVTASASPPTSPGNLGLRHGPVSVLVTLTGNPTAVECSETAQVSWPDAQGY